MPINIHTDGSCLGNPGPGGYAAIIHHKKKEVVVCGGEKETTNNRMEMMAIIEALKWLKNKSGLKPDEIMKEEIKLFSDSSLLINTINLNWKKKANKDLWEKIDSLRAWLSIKWVWIKGHASNKYNNKADEIAQKEAFKFKKA